MGSFGAGAVGSFRYSVCPRRLSSFPQAIYLVSKERTVTAAITPPLCTVGPVESERGKKKMTRGRGERLEKWNDQAEVNAEDYPQIFADVQIADLEFKSAKICANLRTMIREIRNGHVAILRSC